GMIEGFHNWTKRPIFVRKELNLIYFLQQIHFQWENDSHGSEHSIDGKQSSAEMHLVFSLNDESVEEAKNMTNGLLVVGVLLEVLPGSRLGIYEDLRQIDDAG
ncbi:hypothetical protein PMAYCL1PPCAC_29123, partial [Pristionchus mayeri]